MKPTLRIAIELERLSNDLERFGGDLCADPDLIARNVETLQAIDLIAQQQRCLASLLQAEEFEAALADCQVAALAERLRGG